MSSSSYFSCLELLNVQVGMLKKHRKEAMFSNMAAMITLIQIFLVLPEEQEQEVTKKKMMKMFIDILEIQQLHFLLMTEVIEIAADLSIVAPGTDVMLAAQLHDA